MADQALAVGATAVQPITFRHGISASQTIDGSMTGKKFLAYRTMPCTQGHRYDRQPAGTQGCRCSRRLNPIEMPFSKLKADLRKAVLRRLRGQ
jgi:hypothetical protein